ncbi:PWWP domain-containing DNA repair factor 3A [Callorhinchus milii]|uniref:PWWP domain-containing protein MUM1-like protein n=1 Tax=Callorhinchus milii TaxID=7868 RepID=A0A4W3HA78_CALMI|nr:PWWP domain-containing DNA repair factor 3A [Callorhinchus milii]|eukprot:gi/632961737/ref/XP_007896927.1/ PREDICTED: PWWP domain-containing protein MUM1 [Callorhinchus milii]
MALNNYIFCKWQGRLWPAKVVIKSGISPKIASETNPDSVDVQLICLKKKLRIKHTDTKPFEKKQAEQISKGLQHNIESTHEEALEELTYRKALRIAIDLLESQGSGGAPNTNGISVPRENGRQSPQGRARRQCRSQAPCSKRTPEPRRRKSTDSRGLSRTVKEPKAYLKKEEGGLRKSSQVTQNNNPSFSQTDTSSPYPSLRSRQLAADNPKCKDKEMRTPWVGRKSSVKGRNSVRQTAEKDQNQKSKRDRCKYKVANKSASTDCSARADCNQQQLDFADNLESTPKRRTASTFRSFGLSQTLNEADSNQTETKRLLGQSERRGRKKLKKSPEHVECLTTSTAAAKLDNPLEPLQNERTQQQFTDLAIELPENGPMDPPNVHNQTSSSGSSLPYFPYNDNKQQDLPLSGTGEEERGLELLTSPVTKPAMPLRQPWDNLEFTSEDTFSNESKEENGAAAEEEEEDEEEELPSILQQKKRWVVAEGLLVWCKFNKYPYWPAVVRSVKRKYKKASILFVDENVLDAKEKSRRGICVSVRTLKPFDCEERQQLMTAARKTYNNAIDWCVGLIDDYRIRRGCHSFTGSFVEYCAAELSIPVRRTSSQDPMTFPCTSIEEETELESQTETTPSRQQRVKKLLPDRRKAARDRANERLVHFIVQAKGVEKHLQAVIKGQQYSHWLDEYKSRRQNSGYIDTYLEDDRQVDKVVTYLQSVCDRVSLNTQLREDCEESRFILDVLLPEAIIHAIAEVDRMSIKQAEEKYLKGPLHSGREVEHFNEEVEQQMKMKVQLKKPSTG